MYELIIEKGKVSKMNFDTMNELEEFLYEADHELEFDYKIVEIKTGSIIGEGTIESSQDVIDGSMNDMFPDEGSDEGFNWT